MWIFNNYMISVIVCKAADFMGDVDNIEGKRETLCVVAPVGITTALALSVPRSSLLVFGLQRNSGI